MGKKVDNKNRKKKRRWLKRTLLTISIAVLVLILTAIGTNLYVVNSTNSLRLSEDAAAVWTADYVLVLGCGLRPDGSPSDMLADRMTVGVALYQAGAAPKLLLTGDNSEQGYNEPAAMEQFALEAGVPAEDIILDYAGFSTYDSLYRARDVFGVKRVIIVTQGYHLGRALYIARALGLDVRGVTADVRTYGGQRHRDVREIAARSKDFFSSWLKPKPKFLHEKST